MLTIKQVVHKMKQDSIEVVANQAVFHYQLPTSRAVKHVITRTRCDRGTALKAISKVMIGYKHKSH